MSEKDQILEKAMNMPPAERAELIDQLIRSLDQPDEKIEALWKKEAEGRVRAYEAGNIQAATLQDVIKKYKDM